MLINQTWQPLPGTNHAEIYPYLRKPDLLSSNSCMIRTREQIILIDAGALAAQTVDLHRTINECQQEHVRPVVIYLTHCHIDHSLQAGRHRQLSVKAPAWIAVQDCGADYLIDGDPGKTIAELYGMPIPSQQPDIRLLTGQDIKRKTSRHINLAPGVHLTLCTQSVATGSGSRIVRQICSIGGGDQLEIYPAPGHSPDGICIRVGEVLFIGDLLAAANPMVAGISGWSREQLKDTLQRVLWLFEHEPIRLCYPGHGPVLEADQARDVLQRLHQKTCRLGEVALMNEDRLFQITDFALELIDEAEEVFSSIAGRLLYVAHRLEELEEADAARRCRDAMPMEKIDACLLKFRNLCLSLEAGKIRRVEFAHGALNIVLKIRSVFDPRPLCTILPQSLVNRGTALLLDFIGIAGGCRNLEEFILADLNALAREVMQARQAHPHLDASMIDDADDDDRYLAALVVRIGHPPASARPDLTFTPAENLPFVRMAAGRFLDTLSNFLEWLERDDPPSIVIMTGIDQLAPFMTIRLPGRDVAAAAPHGEQKIRSFIRRFRLCGLMLKKENSGYRLTPVEDLRE